MRMKGKLVGVCLGVAFTVAACAPETVVPEETISEIVGGTETDGDPAVVALYGREPGASQGILCTSTLIAPTVLLTAAHCLDPRTTGSSTLEYIGIFAPKLSEATDADKVRVVSTHFDPAFDPANLPGGHDVGVAILERPVSVTPMPYNRSEITAAHDGQPVRIVGYGVSNGIEQSGAGIKRQATAPLTDHDDLLLHIGDTFTTTCQGDSGGPAFMNIDGVPKVVGITSFGFIYCLFGGYSTRVDRYLSFIDPYVADSPDPETCTGLESEPNSRRSTASSLCDSGRINGTVRTGTDIDWYKFDVPANSKYTVRLTNVEKHYNMKLYKVVDGGVGLVAEAEDTYPELERSLVKRTVSGGKYYVRVASVDGSSDGQTLYGLTVETDPL
jgi:hypothetical protein